jgi:putative peptide zinc metalloprotease protein
MATTRRSKIELLVRAEGGASFETREVESLVAYLQHRPQRISLEQCEFAQMPTGIQRTPMWVLKNRQTERYIMISDAEKFLWEKMDGQASLQDLATAYVLRYGAFDFDIIPTLITKLRQAGLLTMRPASRLREALARHRRNPAARAAESALKAIEKLTVASRTAHDIFVQVYRYGGFLLFTPVGPALLLLSTLLGIRGASNLWADSGEISAALAKNPVVAILLVKVFFFLTLISHQIIHALALVHYGRRVREFGFTILHGFIPTFYADVTDIFMSSRRARIMAAVSGPLVHLFLGTFYLWVASLQGPGLLKGFLAASAILQLQSLFVALYPFCFVEMDGYHVLVDLLAMPTLNHDAAHFVRHGLWHRLRQGRALNRQEVIFVSYVVLSAVSVVGFIWLNVAIFAHAGSS